MSFVEPRPSAAPAGLRAPGLVRVTVRLALLAAVWAAAVALTGGLLVDAGPLRISSRNPVNPAALAAALFAAACLLAPHGRRLHTLIAEVANAIRSLLPGAVRRRWRQAIAAADPVVRRLPGSPGLPAVAAFVLAIGMSGLGIDWGALVVGGTDTYGYVSYGHLWAAGTLHVAPPWMEQVARAVEPIAGLNPIAPVGYLVAADGASLVPTYSPGLPMVMGALERITGHPGAVFLAAPLLAGLGIWATYLLGRRIGGPGTGLMAATLLAAHPVFLHYLLRPAMSDLPAMAWWTLALALVIPPARGAALGAGLAAGAAILTRPNLVPLALVPALLIAWPALRARRVGSLDVQRTLLFAAGVVPACLALAWLNDYWFGSPLLSGYGPLRSYFSLAHFPVNVIRYPAWLLETSPLLAVAAGLWLAYRPPLPATVRQARPLLVASAAFALVTIGSYLFYLTFDGWWALRFVAPALPPLAVLTCIGLAAVVPRLPPLLHGLVPLLLCAAVLYGVGFAARHTLDHHHEYRYPDVGRYIAERLPEHALFISLSHSGSVPYYANRPTVRFDFLASDALEPVIHALRDSGYHPYLLLEPWDEEPFRERFGPHSAFGRLDWEPMVIEPWNVRIYDTLARDRVTPSPAPWHGVR